MQSQSKSEQVSFENDNWEANFKSFMKMQDTDLKSWRYELWRFTLLFIKTYKVIVMKCVWYWLKDEQKDPAM